MAALMTCEMSNTDKLAEYLEECRRLWQGYLEAGEPPVAVGFVLRYAPFYTRVAELIGEAELGQLLAIDAVVQRRQRPGAPDLGREQILELVAHRHDIADPADDGAQDVLHPPASIRF